MTKYKIWYRDGGVITIEAHDDKIIEGVMILRGRNVNTVIPLDMIKKVESRAE